jgi:hypothetical protein
MTVEERDVSVIRSVRQQEFARTWQRAFARSGSCPAYAEFGLSRAEDEIPDLMLFRVWHKEEKDPRFKIESDGARAAAAWGFSGRGQYVDQAIGARRWSSAKELYHLCVARASPKISTSEVKDRDGRPVLHERLLLPFGDKGIVTQIFASLKSIAIEGKFHNEMLLSRKEGRSYLVSSRDIPHQPADRCRRARRCRGCLILREIGLLAS